MNVECPDRWFAVHSSSTPLGRALTRAFKLSADVPADLAERLMQLPGQAEPAVRRRAARDMQQ